MFAESNATLEAFVKKNRDSELIGTAELGIAANLESMGKMDEALAKYQKVAADYPKSYTAPLALFSQVPLLKAKKQTDAARRVCETILTQYRESMWASQAMMELRSLKPSDGSQPPSVSNKPPPPAISGRPPMRLPETGPPPAVPPPGPVPSAAKPPKRN
jgi:tetratricopeptide (TPR) repeat protein